MKLLRFAYEKINGKPAPYYYDYSILTVLGKPQRKWIANVIASNCVFNNLRIFLYRLCGFKLGKHTFFGMHCYMDDMFYDLMTIGKNVTISYGVYFACHGKNQGNYPIKIQDGAYIGARATIISKDTQDIVGGHFSEHNNTRKCDYRSLHACKQYYSSWIHCRWNSLQDYREIKRSSCCTYSEVPA